MCYKDNFQKYSMIHTEVMNRLEDGQITVEMAKAINSLAFDKYLTENTNSDSNVDYAKILYDIAVQESVDHLIDKDMFNNNTYLTEAYYGENEYLDEITTCFETLKSKILRNPKGSQEIKTIEANLAKLFGFETVYFTVLPAKYMNACTVPFFMEYKHPQRKDFEIEKTSNGIRYKDPTGKSLYVYMTSYTIEKFTPRECTSVLLHEVGHNFYAVEDYYKYLRSNTIRSIIIQAILQILNGNIAYGLLMLVDLYSFCKSPQRYQDQYLQRQTENYKSKAKDPNVVINALKVFFKTIGNVIGAVMSPVILLFTLPAVYLRKLFNKFRNSVDDHDYLSEKFCDDFAASYGYAKEVADIFKTNRKLSYDSEMMDNIPILNLLDSYNNAVYNSAIFLTDCHPERHQRCVNMLNKLKYELQNNADTLTPTQKKKISDDIIAIEEIIRKSSASKHPIARLIQDKLKLVEDRDKLASDVVTDETLFDFEEKIFGDKH